jgi:hypothetical protein
MIVDVGGAEADRVCSINLSMQFTFNLVPFGVLRKCFNAAPEITVLIYKRGHCLRRG